MTTKQNMRKRNHTQVKALLAEITPAEKLRTQTKMGLAARIDDLIREKRWSKSEFAKKLDKQPSEVSKWLSGTHNFTIDTLADIAILFNLSVTELIEAKPAPPINTVHYLVYLADANQSIKYITPSPSHQRIPNDFQSSGLNYCVSD
jgi:transcriptional regulator with XRE-family HTH domain